MSDGEGTDGGAAQGDEETPLFARSALHRFVLKRLGDGDGDGELNEAQRRYLEMVDRNDTPPEATS